MDMRSECIQSIGGQSRAWHLTEWLQTTAVDSLQAEGERQWRGAEAD